MKAFTITTLLNLALLVSAVPPFALGAKTSATTPARNSSAANASPTQTAPPHAAPPRRESARASNSTSTSDTTPASSSSASNVAAAAVASGSAAAGTNSAGGPAFDPSGAKNVGNAAGVQFIGGQCLSGADCA
ncbi:hypothetical protein LAWI1_G002202, partial [Lachnellula willkommii]